MANSTSALQQLHQTTVKNMRIGVKYTAADAVVLHKYVSIDDT